MSDIFVSYASADRDRARAVAQALTDQGWSVWWDRTIPPGRQFDEVIEEALDSARCVVVLWSKASVASQWVKTEAAEAMRRKILVPVLIEDVKIPLEFRRLQAADLSTWTGGDTHEEVRKFFASIGTNVGQLAAPVQERAGVFKMFGVPEEPALDLASHINRTMADCILDLYRSAVDVGKQWGPDFVAIPAPGLVIIPSEDPFLNMASATRAAARSGARTAALDGLGHWWMLQDPARAATVLREFWATLA